MAFDSPTIKSLPLITIHSNEKLPVKEFVLKKIDPVLIGWVTLAVPPADIYTNWYPTVGEGHIGVVLAVWNNDKELEI